MSATTTFPSIDLVNDVMPLSEFRNSLTECIARTRRTHRPILVTQNGKSATVMFSVEDFERLRETFEMAEDIRISETEIERGEVMTTAEVESSLKEEGLM
jgi:prevent-host-death family protein